VSHKAIAFKAHANVTVSALGESHSQIDSDELSVSHGVWHKIPRMEGAFDTSVVMSHLQHCSTRFIVTSAAHSHYKVNLKETSLFPMLSILMHHPSHEVGSVAMSDFRTQCLASELAASFNFGQAVRLCSLTGEVNLKAQLDDELWDAIGGLPGIYRMYRQARLLMRLSRLGLRPVESGKMRDAYRALKGSAPLCVLECLAKVFCPMLRRANARAFAELFAEIFLQCGIIIELIDFNTIGDIS
jgi:hypothetical protein